jgi:hypothetical protein
MQLQRAEHGDKAALHLTAKSKANIVTVSITRLMMPIVINHRQQLPLADGVFESEIKS